MTGPRSTGTRLRQAVLAVKVLEPAFERLRDGLGLGRPYRDNDVALFGLENTVGALGDDFLEIISPVREGTAAGRQIDRRGDCGYMLIFQVEDLEGARRRAQDLGIRTAFGVDLDDISCTHLHPADLGGTIVSIDRPEPPESWHWGGPDWTGKAGLGAPGRIAGATVQVPDPEPITKLWAEVLGVEAESTTLHLGRDQSIEFERGDGGLVEIKVEVPDGPSEPLEFGSARVVRV